MSFKPLNLGDWRGALAAFAKSKTGKQVARFARLAAVGVLTAAVSGSPLTVAGVVAVAEVAFRQVWS